MSTEMTAETPQERLGEVWEVTNMNVLTTATCADLDHPGGDFWWVAATPATDAAWWRTGDVVMSAVRRLHEGLTPPRPEVPTKRGAVVKCDDGREWVNTTHQPDALYASWLCVTPTSPSRWQSLDHIATNITEVLFEGIDGDGIDEDEDGAS